MIAAQKGWTIETADIKCAFLQGAELEREVFLRPPKERRVNGVVWKMKKRAYGFVDASRGFYIELSNALQELGCKKSQIDPAVYRYFDEDGKLSGLILTHVDDVLHGSGTDEFKEKVLLPLKKRFQFGKEEKEEFRYVGMQVKQKKDGIVVNQDHYIEMMDVPDVILTEDNSEVLEEEGQTDFRGLVGKIGWLAGHSRPDVVFDHITLSTKVGHASVGDLKQAMKVMRKLRGETTEMKFSILGRIEDWKIEGHGDAGYKSLPDKVSSCGGQVIVVRDTQSNASCVLNWRGRKLRRIVNSSTAAEALSLVETISEAIFVKAMLKEMLGNECDQIPIEVFTDSKNVEKALSSTGMVEDPRLRVDIASMKESLENGEVAKVVHVSGKEMIADCLTKKGASAQNLLQLMRAGRKEN